MKFFMLAIVALLCLSNSWAQSKPKVLVRVPVENAKIRDELRAIETYDGERIHALKIAGPTSSKSIFSKVAGEVLSKDFIVLKDGKVIPIEKVESVLVVRKKTTSKMPFDGERGKFPAQDGTAGGGSTQN